MPVVTDAHREARRRQILDAAIECFTRDGFHRTTMQDIIAEAGLSAGAIYGYFGGKEDIIEAIADERHAREATFIEEAEMRDGPTDAVREVARLFLSSLADEQERKRRRLGIQGWAEALRNPNVAKLVRKGTERVRRRLGELVRDGQERGELPAEADPDAMARVMVSIFQGFVLQQAWDPRLRPGPYLDAVEVILDALRAQARAPR
jgi:TetR/AcrR family transcriptional regulator, transcriptional repressor of aconitase